MAAAAAAVVPLPQEVSAARRLLVEVEGVAAEAKKKIAVVFDQMIGCNFTMNLPSPCREAWTERGAVDLFARLFLHKAEVHAKNANGNSALHFAVFSGQRGAIERLLDRGAQVNESNQAGYSAFDWAGGSVNDHRDAAELLLSRGANVNARDDEGNTILHCAAHFGLVDVAEIVLDVGADVQTTDNLGWTALHHVVWRSAMIEKYRVDYQKKLRIAQMLISRGINVNAVTNDGMTALALAKRDLPADSPIRTFLVGLPPQLQQQ
uniref:Uncharacterized protein n=1 Tax=Chromera velia CCMP2878 TaxID=1169474 RepID=A0A0G4HIY1_9ALVE|eukprot:Cvel_28098.t1-p1 / transcript=Cvel_28098.t1 / gene=Cvel_28098 / organism=Chromera_velia_CCMP2878 / gene_product=Putative ankyrin repeat protein RF_0381, putative / transcript_product=Putative ankyrin repeat protein RF_0381, putative / location=Cvel_scaffold3617:11310-12448(-) / protein_length=263 / sequence_SO=supercontig / SO=protein_coding / is_pseudo=false